MNTRERTNARRALADKRGKLAEALQDMTSELYKGLAVTHDLPHRAEIDITDPAGYRFRVQLEMWPLPEEET